MSLLQANVSLSAQLHTSRVCSYDDTVLDCSHLELQEFSIPPNINISEVETLKLNHNELSTVPNLTLFGNLHTLDLSFNRIHRLQSDAFYGLTELEYLDISMNENFSLSNLTVNQTAFQSLQNLKIIK